MAIGSFYFTYKTPVGADFLKLVPNFPSNQGLTVIYNSLGSGTVAPTMILVTTPTPIVYGNNQFNNTLLNEIELISDRAANSSGVTTVVGPTRPFGSAFDYSSVQNMSDALRAQYLEGMMSQIGKNNKTALISVGLKNDSESQAATDALLKMEKNVNGLTLPKGVAIYYGGDAQSTYDSVSFIRRSFTRGNSDPCFGGLCHTICTTSLGFHTASFDLHSSLQRRVLLGNYLTCLQLRAQAANPRLRPAIRRGYNARSRNRLRHIFRHEDTRGGSQREERRRRNQDRGRKGLGYDIWAGLDTRECFCLGSAHGNCDISGDRPCRISSDSHRCRCRDSLLCSFVDGPR